jgi:hypothetical protein
MSDTGSRHERLELSAAQHTAIRAFAGLLHATVELDPRGLAAASGSAVHLLLTASSVGLTAGLPTCHFAPPGAAISPSWSSASSPSAPPVHMVLRCAHTAADGGPHCWDLDGWSTTC